MSAFDDAARAQVEELLRVTAAHARKQLEEILSSQGAQSDIDLDKWLYMLNGLVMKLMVGLGPEVQHVIVLGSGSLETGLEVYTAAGQSDPEPVRKLLEFGLGTLYEDEDEEDDCPLCGETTESN